MQPWRSMALTDIFSADDDFTMCQRRTYRNSSINKSSMQERGYKENGTCTSFDFHHPQQKLHDSHTYSFVIIFSHVLHFPLRGYFPSASSYAGIFAILENQEKLGNRPCMWCVIWSPFFIAVRRREAWIHVVLSSAVPRLGVMCHGHVCTYAHCLCLILVPPPLHIHCLCGCCVLLCCSLFFPFYHASRCLCEKKNNEEKFGIHAHSRDDRAISLLVIGSKASPPTTTSST